MATLWPRQEPRHTDSEAEKKVYEALKTGLPKGWFERQKNFVEGVQESVGGKKARLI
jgi:hypothetical protein